MPKNRGRALFAISPDQGYARAKEWALKTLDAILAMCEKYPELVGPALTPDDAYRLEKQGLRAAFIGVENGYPVGKSLENLEEYYRMGVRYLTLCHSRDNDICDSWTDRQDPEDRGLSDFGREVVGACNRLGMMVDVSHISDKSFYEVLAATRAPVIASHSSCRALCDNPGNLSDEMIRALARKGGVVQICFLSAYLSTPKPNPERDQALKELREKYGSMRETAFFAPAHSLDWGHLHFCRWLDIRFHPPPPTEHRRLPAGPCRRRDCPRPSGWDEICPATGTAQIFNIFKILDSRSILS